MAQPQPAAPIQAPVSPTGSQGQMQQSLWRRFFGRDKDNGNHGSTDASSKGPGSEQQEDRAGIIRRVSRKVVPGLPRAQTFKRQQSELRDKLEPVKQTPAERRAVSVDRRVHASISAFSQSNPRTSAPDFLSRTYSATASVPSLPASPTGETMEPMLGSIGEMNGAHGVDGEAADAAVDDCLDHPVPEHLEAHIGDDDNHSMTTSQYDNMIHDELESIWILNLSMHFRDKSKREKFFVTYRQHNTLWRRVTVSLDYRNAPENSLELDLVQTKFQRDKSAKIYEAIRESLHDIQFYDTVTNLKLQTTEGRLHVHVVEDVNEIICYPTVRMIQHMKCRRVKERELEFDSHLSGFVYKVRVNGEVLIKKEIPGPDTVDEFLYEINALNRLRFAENVIQFYGVVVDDKEENIKGLLISYADQGALIDIIYDHNHSLPWSTREKWARQIVNGLAEIHEAGFVQGDFTLSNIVINDEGDAKIIDINRRGCPVGWEPPEATPLIESNQRISMYIGVKSDLFQLGMVLWALATQEDEPEAHGRPLRIAADVQVPHWFRQIVSICLSEDPRRRLQALQLASLFPDPREDSQYGPLNGSAVSVDDRYSHQEFGVDSYTADGSRLRPGEQGNHWSYMGWGSPPPPAQEDLYYYPQRGRSPPSPMPSNHGEPSRYGTHLRPWSEKHHAALTAPSVSDVSPSELPGRSDVDLRQAGEPTELTQTTTRARFGDVVSAQQRTDGDGNSSPRTIPAQPAVDGDDSGLCGGGKGGKTTPIRSLTDSGKDLSVPMVAPAAISATEGLDGERTQQETSRELEKDAHAGRESLSETPRPRSREDAAHDSNSEAKATSLFTATSFSSSRATSTSTPVRQVPDELKGIGSAYDLASDGRLHAIMIDDDFGLDTYDPHSDLKTIPRSRKPPLESHSRHVKTTAAVTTTTTATPPTNSE